MKKQIQRLMISNNIELRDSFMRLYNTRNAISIIILSDTPRNIYFICTAVTLTSQLIVFILLLEKI